MLWRLCVWIIVMLYIVLIYTEDDLLCDMMEEAQTQVRLNCSLVQNICRRVVKFLEIELW